MQSNGLLIYGTGGHAKVICSAAILQGTYRVSGFIVDRDVAPGETFLGAPLVRFDELPDRKDLPRHFIVGIGDNSVRQMKTRCLESLSFEAVNVIHPFANISIDVRMGRGILIGPGASIDPDVTIGDGVIFNVGSAVGHESSIGDFCHIGPNSFMGAISKIGDRTFTAMTSTVISGANVGRDCFIATGAVVTKDVPDNMIALGSPARFRSREAATEVVA
jgi:acetyltransferase EpsM